MNPTSAKYSRTARPKLRVIAAMMALATTPSHGLWLGEPLVRSHLGEPLRVDIPYRLEEGETIDDRCLTLGGQNIQSADGLDFLQRGRVRLVEYGLERAILITTQQTQGEPVVKARLQVDCGAKVNLARDYMWLLDPPSIGNDGEQSNVPPMPALAVETAAAAVPVRAEHAARAESAATAPAQTGELAPAEETDGTPRRRIVAPGETLADVARELAPNDEAKQAEIVRAIIAANPELFAGTPANEIHAGTELKLPDPAAPPPAATAAERRETKRAARRARAETRRAAHRTPAGEHARTPNVAAPVSDLDRSADAAAIEARKAIAETRKTLAEAKRIGAGGPLPDTAAELLAAGTSTRREGQYQFALTLSRIDESAAPARPRTAAERRAHDEANDDDRQATILSLREQVKNLQNEIASLQAIANGRPTGATSAPAAPQAPSAPVAPASSATLAVPQPPRAMIVPPLKEKQKTTPVAVRTADWSDTMWTWLARMGLPVGVAGAIGLALLAWRRRGKSFDAEYPVTIPPMPVSANEPSMGDDVPASVKSADLRPEAPAATETDLAFIPANAADQRIVSREQRLAYLAERFPEVAHGDLSMDDEDAVIEASRVYFEGDGETDKAVELLEFSIADEPERIKPWLAQFEILRRANRAAAFEKLAARFRTQFGENEYWREICSAGLELAPENEAFAAGHAPVAAEQDEWAAANPENAAPSNEAERRDNWLNAPLDFTPELLASDLRDNLLADFREEEPAQAKEPPPAKKETKPPLSMADEGEAVGN